MQPSEEAWTVLRSPTGSGSVALAITEMTGYGQPASVRLCAGGHEVDRACELADPYGFLTSLAEVHRSLRGQAKLEAVERDFELVLAGDGEGQITVSSKISEHFGGPVDWTFDVRFSVDQSYLPAFSQALRAALTRADS